MQSKDILKNALLTYEGTLIVVSHDRDFLQGLTNKVFEFRNRNIREYIGDVYDFLETRRLKSLRQLEYKDASKKTEEKAQTSDSKQQYEHRKELDREIRKLVSRIEKIEQDIADIEHRMAELDSLFADSTAMASDTAGQHFREYDGLKKDLAGRMREWEETNVSLDELQKERTSLLGGD
jgi:ATP-binding cassette subfamily F protein 3